MFCTRLALLALTSVCSATVEVGFRYLDHDPANHHDPAADSIEYSRTYEDTNGEPVTDHPPSLQDTLANLGADQEAAPLQDTLSRVHFSNLGGQFEVIQQIPSYSVWRSLAGSATAEGGPENADNIRRLALAERSETVEAINAVRKQLFDSFTADWTLPQKLVGAAKLQDEAVFRVLEENAESALEHSCRYDTWMPGTSVGGRMNKANFNFTLEELVLALGHSRGVEGGNWGFPLALFWRPAGHGGGHGGERIRNLIRECLDLPVPEAERSGKTFANVPLGVIQENDPQEEEGRRHSRSQLGLSLFDEGRRLPCTHCEEKQMDGEAVRQLAFFRYLGAQETAEPRPSCSATNRNTGETTSPTDFLSPRSEEDDETPTVPLTRRGDPWYLPLPNGPPTPTSENNLLTADHAWTAPEDICGLKFYGTTESIAKYLFLNERDPHGASAQVLESFQRLEGMGVFGDWFLQMGWIAIKKWQGTVGEQELAAAINWDWDSARNDSRRDEGGPLFDPDMMDRGAHWNQAGKMGYGSSSGPAELVYYLQNYERIRDSCLSQNKPRPQIAFLLDNEFYRLEQTWSAVRAAEQDPRLVSHGPHTSAELLAAMIFVHWLAEEGISLQERGLVFLRPKKERLDLGATKRVDTAANRFRVKTRMELVDLFGKTPLVVGSEMLRWWPVGVGGRGGEAGGTGAPGDGGCSPLPHSLVGLPLSVGGTVLRRFLPQSMSSVFFGPRRSGMWGQCVASRGEGDRCRRDITVRYRVEEARASDGGLRGAEANSIIAISSSAITAAPPYRNLQTIISPTPTLAEFLQVPIASINFHELGARFALTETLKFPSSWEEGAFPSESSPQSAMSHTLLHCIHAWKSVPDLLPTPEEGSWHPSRDEPAPNEALPLPDAERIPSILWDELESKIKRGARSVGEQFRKIVYGSVTCGLGVSRQSSVESGDDVSKCLHVPLPWTAAALLYGGHGKKSGEQMVVVERGLDEKKNNLDEEGFFDGVDEEEAIPQGEDAVDEEEDGLDEEVFDGEEGAIPLGEEGVDEEEAICGTHFLGAVTDEGVQQGSSSTALLQLLGIGRGAPEQLQQRGPITLSSVFRKAMRAFFSKSASSPVLGGTWNGATSLRNNFGRTATEEEEEALRRNNRRLDRLTTVLQGSSLRTMMGDALEGEEDGSREREEGYPLAQAPTSFSHKEAETAALFATYLARRNRAANFCHWRGRPRPLLVLIDDRSKQNERSLVMGMLMIYQQFLKGLPGPRIRREVDGLIVVRENELEKQFPLTVSSVGMKSPRSQVDRLSDTASLPGSANTSQVWPPYSDGEDNFSDHSMDYPGSPPGSPRGSPAAGAEPLLPSTPPSSFIAEDGTNIPLAPAAFDEAALLMQGVWIDNTADTEDVYHMSVSGSLEINISGPYLSGDKLYPVHSAEVETGIWSIGVSTWGRGLFYGPFVLSGEEGPLEEGGLLLWFVDAETRQGRWWRKAAAPSSS